MPKSLFSAGIGAGKASGRYQSSLYDITNRYGEMEFAGKKASLDIENLNKKVATAASVLEIGSTLAGGYEDRKELEGEYLPALEESRFKKEYKGKLSFEEFKAQEPEKYAQKFESSKVERSIWDRLKGDKQMYQFGFDDDAKQFSKTDLTAAGKYAKGVSDWEDLGLDTDYFGFKPDKSFAPYKADYSNIGVDDYEESFPWSMMDEAGRTSFEKARKEDSSLNIYDWYRDDKNPIWD